MVGDHEFGNAVIPQREPVVELGYATREGAIEAQRHHPVGVINAASADLPGGVLELGPGVSQERVDLFFAAEGLALVDEHRVLGEERRGGVGVADDVGGEEVAHGSRERTGREIGVVCHEPTVRPHGAGESSAGLSPRGRVQTVKVLSIGEFSRLTHLSVRTLRRYHEAALLEPAVVDGTTGYRYYSVGQIPAAQIIHRLRELDVPLSDVQRILQTPDPAVRAALVTDHLQRLEDALDRTRAAVVSLRRLLRPDPAPIDVELRAEPARTVAAVEAVVSHHEVAAWYAGAMAELEAAVGPAVTGPPGGTYDNALFEQERGHALVYLPTATPPRTGRVHPAILPAAELAITTHASEHDGIEVTYGALGTWVVQNAMSVAGPVREVYMVGPRDASDPAAWRTEIGWPVFRVT